MKDYVKDKVWNAYCIDLNKDELRQINVFGSARFSKCANETIHEYKTDKIDIETFKEELRRDLMYSFWSKYEYEVCITSVFDNRKVDEKIDVYQQVMINFDRFVEYVLE